MRMKHILALMLVMAFAFASVGNAVTSSATIAIKDTGKKGSDMGFAKGTAKLSGDQYNAEARTTLYVAAQEQGHYAVGGVLFKISVAPGKTNSGSGSVAKQGLHVLLDPSGPNSSGCKGTGSLKQ